MGTEPKKNSNESGWRTLWRTQGRRVGEAEGRSDRVIIPITYLIDSVIGSAHILRQSLPGLSLSRRPVTSAQVQHVWMWRMWKVDIYRLAVIRLDRPSVVVVRRYPRQLTTTEYSTQLTLCFFCCLTHRHRFDLATCPSPSICRLIDKQKRRRGGTGILFAKRNNFYRGDKSFQINSIEGEEFRDLGWTGLDSRWMKWREGGGSTGDRIFDFPQERNSRSQ